jgi:uncharacterized protein YegL
MPSEAFLREQDLISNPTTRVPVCLCLDVSGSMQGSPIQELTKGVHLFFEEVFKDEASRYAAEISIVTFANDAQMLADFANVERQDRTPSFFANGGTSMGEGLHMALDALEKRKKEYQDKGVDYFQPWLVIMTDGQPNGNALALEEAIRRTSDMQQRKKLVIFPIGIGGDADMDVLKRISPAWSPLRLQGLKFSEFFQWLSSSVATTSQSMPGEDIHLDFEGIKGWGSL